MVETQRQLGLPVSLEISENYLAGKPPTQVVSRELFYIAQEAVVNAVKHASASKIEISLLRSEDKVRLAVRNDGRGFDVASMLTGRETRGMGIMQARASRIDGKLTISSNPGTGTEVAVSVETIP
jgi:signal transduction histidine kinase